MFYWEIMGTILGIIGVYLAYKNSYWGFVIGLGNTLIYIFICWHGKLYGESFLNLYYTIMNIAGWINWVRKKKDHTLAVPISFCTKKEWLLSILSLLFLWYAIYCILHYFTDSKVPILDSFTVAASYIGMAFLVWRKIENWLWWIVVNIVSIGLFYHKGYTITCLQYVVLLVIAVKAYQDWHKEIRLTRKEIIEN